jgi:hypothetical protein
MAPFWKLKGHLTGLMDYRIPVCWLSSFPYQTWRVNKAFSTWFIAYLSIANRHIYSRWKMRSTCVKQMSRSKYSYSSGRSSRTLADAAPRDTTNVSRDWEKRCACPCSSMPHRDRSSLNLRGRLPPARDPLARGDPRILHDLTAQPLPVVFFPLSHRSLQRLARPMGPCCAPEHLHCICRAATRRPNMANHQGTRAHEEGGWDEDA